MISSILNHPISTTHSWLVMMAILAFCTIYAARHWRHPRTHASVVAASATVFVVWLVLVVLWRPLPDEIPTSIFLVSVAALFVIFRTILIAKHRLVMALLSLLSVVCVYGTVNYNYQQYPTLHSFKPAPTSATFTYPELQEFIATHPGEAPALNGRPVGALIDVDLASVTSNFDHRNALVYLPPRYFTHPLEKFPVVVLMAGNPGSPSQWFTAGGASITLDEYQASHDGNSPIVVAADGTGSLLGNPMCIGASEQYLSVDVPNQLKEKFRTLDDPKHWAIGGLSWGGTCSLQLITNRPGVYRTFLDFSGQAHPVLTSRNETIATLFGGDEAAYNNIDPAVILERVQNTDTFKGISGRFIAGEKDEASIKALTHLDELARGAGMDTTFHTVEGGHNYMAWRAALKDSLDFAVESTR